MGRSCGITWHCLRLEIQCRSRVSQCMAKKKGINISVVNCYLSWYRAKKIHQPFPNCLEPDINHQDVGNRNCNDSFFDSTFRITIKLWEFLLNIRSSAICPTKWFSRPRQKQITVLVTDRPSLPTITLSLTTVALFQSATQVTPQDIFESFLVNHNLVWNQIVRNSFAGTAPRLNDFEVLKTSGSIDLCPQSEKQRSILKNRYTPEKCYYAKENIASTSSLDLSATKGSLVAVIKKQDPMGDSSRWFVDNGVAQGFLPSRSLEPVLTLKNCTESADEIADSAYNLPDLMSLDSPEKTVTRTSSLNSNTSWYLNVENVGDDSVDSTSIDDLGQAQRYQNINPEVRIKLSFF